MSGACRIVCCRAVSLCQDYTETLEESVFQLEAVVWEFTDSEDRTSAKTGCLWTGLTLRDCSGSATLFTAEEALLGMTKCNSKEENLELLNQDALPQHRVCGRVHRSVKMEASKTYVNVVLMEAVPVFSVAPERALSATEWCLASLFKPPSNIYPECLFRLRWTSIWEGIAKTLQRVGS